MRGSLTLCANATHGPRRSHGSSQLRWEREKNDTGSFDAIIADDIVSGPSRITLKKGEYFKAHGGCTWTKS
ncbi:hypothetical protein VSH64_16195 [Amycolatopsis rhabdoformis]|uniref:Uncharacterized protein n=1 Tax=Amycolatopsis rhabdoformis TaxID=1448059 RepID=A0ABZ1IGT0_9PSEU|nr:hypothetical protein [Amycolatopsis rhabdoformis]WSE33629.1 hypothetical protein VSH64_16195 [Amycolatopsis rhabdoformis]